MYDIGQYRRLHQHHRRPSGAQPAQRWQPLVTVAISAHNEELVIERCLESILASKYKNVQIVVIDDASADATLAIARRWRRKHKQIQMSVAHMSKNVGKGRALNYGLEHLAKGELCMTLDADSLLDPTAIGRAVAYFTDPSIVGVAANVRIIEEHTVLSALQQFEHMIGYRSKKFYSITGCEFVIGGVASTYRMSVLKQVDFYSTDTVTEDIGLSTKIASLGNRAYRIVYGADIAAMTEGVGSFKALFRQRYRWKYGSLQNLVKYRWLIANTSKKYTRSLTMYRLPMAILSEIVLLLAPFVWAYVIYASWVAHDPRLVVGVYFTITLYSLLTLWFDEHTTIFNRLRLSIYAPIMYFIFYVMDLVQLVAVVRCIYKLRHLIQQKDVGGTWVSPQRAGREVHTA
jgi:cellulose synthase/poly-beta-1,6-N-acetylglucosamine synthase-like glycosyltransferase